jgi:hypothetical protein
VCLGSTRFKSRQGYRLYWLVFRDYCRIGMTGRKSCLPHPHRFIIHYSLTIRRYIILEFLNYIYIPKPSWCLVRNADYGAPPYVPFLIFMIFGEECKSWSSLLWTILRLRDVWWRVRMMEPVVIYYSSALWYFCLRDLMFSQRCRWRSRLLRGWVFLTHFQVQITPHLGTSAVRALTYLLSYLLHVVESLLRS